MISPQNRGLYYKNKNMNNYKTGDTVKLKKGSPIMEVIMEATQYNNIYVCGWFDGLEYCQIYCQGAELKYG